MRKKTERKSRKKKGQTEKKRDEELKVFCPMCRGQGWVFRSGRTVLNGIRICPACHGTGNVTASRVSPDDCLRP